MLPDGADPPKKEEKSDPSDDLWLFGQDLSSVFENVDGSVSEKIICIYSEGKEQKYNLVFFDCVF